MVKVFGLEEGALFALVLTSLSVGALGSLDSVVTVAAYRRYIRGFGSVARWALAVAAFHFLAKCVSAGASAFADYTLPAELAVRGLAVWGALRVAVNSEREFFHETLPDGSFACDLPGHEEGHAKSHGGLRQFWLPAAVLGGTDAFALAQVKLSVAGAKSTLALAGGFVLGSAVVFVLTFAAGAAALALTSAAGTKLPRLVALGRAFHVLLFFGVAAWLVADGAAALFGPWWTSCDVMILGGWGVAVVWFRRVGERLTAVVRMIGRR